MVKITENKLKGTLIGDYKDFFVWEDVLQSVFFLTIKNGNIYVINTDLYREYEIDYIGFFWSLPKKSRKGLLNSGVGIFIYKKPDNFDLFAENFKEEPLLFVGVWDGEKVIGKTVESDCQSTTSENNFSNENFDVQSSHIQVVMELLKDSYYEHHRYQKPRLIS
jgi:hypothetical protein